MIKKFLDTLPTIWAMSEIEIHKFVAIISSLQIDMSKFAEIEAAMEARHSDVDFFIQRLSKSFAKVNVVGPIMQHESFWTFFGLATSSVTLKKVFNELAADDRIEDVLIEFDTPGGGIPGLVDAADALAHLSKHKNTIAQVSGMTASAGYWLASQTRTIFAGRGDDIGSIGVRMTVVDTSEFFAGRGIKVIAIDTGNFKSAGVEGLPISKEQLANFQETVDKVFKTFLEAIIEGRPGLTMQDLITTPDKQGLADGRMFLAPDALKHGLIDGIATIDSTIATVLGDNAPNPMELSEADNEIIAKRQEKFLKRLEQ